MGMPSSRNSPPLGEVTVASSPGNVFLCGEYAVLHGSDAVIVAPSLRCTAKYESNPGTRLQLLSDIGTATTELSGSAIGDAPESLVPLVDLVSRIQTECGYPPTGCRISLTSKLPIGAGLSSSSAVVAAIALACRYALSGEGSTDGLYELLLPAQKAIHGGSASGTELISSIFGGIHAMTITGASSLSPEGLPCLLVADTGIRRLTRDVLGGIEVNKELVLKANRLSEQVRSAIESSDWTSLGQAMTGYHKHLAKRGASTAKLDELVETALTAGAYGAKLSGAGRGGVVVAIAPPALENKVMAALRKTGMQKVWRVEVDVGARIEYESHS